MQSMEDFEVSVDYVDVALLKLNIADATTLYYCTAGYPIFSRSMYCFYLFLRLYL